MGLNRKQSDKLSFYAGVSTKRIDREDSAFDVSSDESGKRSFINFKVSSRLTIGVQKLEKERLQRFKNSQRLELENQNTSGGAQSNSGNSQSFVQDTPVDYSALKRSKFRAGNPSSVEKVADSQ